jgi:hypothetical protein
MKNKKNIEIPKSADSFVDILWLNTYLGKEREGKESVTALFCFERRTAVPFFATASLAEPLVF